MAPIQVFLAHFGKNVSILGIRNDRSRWKSAVVLLGMMLLPVVFAQAQAFNFNTTVEGWTLTDANTHTGFSSLSWVNVPGATANGGLQYYTSGYNVACPGGGPCDFWINQLHSPNLSADPVWQKAVGYSVRLYNQIPSPQVYANLYVVLYDQDTLTDRFFFSGTAQPIPYASWTTVSFNWANALVGTCTGTCPKHFVVKEIFVDIWGNQGTSYNGAVYLDDAIGVSDTAAPSVAITGPTAATTFTTTSNTINLSGTASDNPVGTAYSQIILVSWANNRGGSGNATYGNGAWSANGITLLPGTNVLTVTARDAAQNTTSTVLTVTYQDTSVTVGTNPAGQSFSINGQTYTTAQTIATVSGTNFTIAATSPQGTGGTRYVFANWSDAGAISHTITAPATPTTYTANFTTQYLLSTMPSPSTAGTITANPTSPDGYYNSGTSVQLTATAGANYIFSGFSGDITATTSPQSIVMSAPRSVMANFIPAVNITVNTNPAGRSFTVDGQTYTSAQTFAWAVESSHTIETTSPQAATGTRYIFANWSDQGAISHTVMALSDTTYTANFTTQYLLTTAALPAAGGSIAANPTSTDGYYASGSSVQLTATAIGLYRFSNFSGDLTGATNPQTITMSAPRSVTANFTPPVNVTINTNPAGLSFTVDGQSYSSSQTFLWQVQSSHTIATTSPQTATATRYGFSNWSDAGAISHAITVPSANATFTANFTAQSYLLSMTVLPMAGGSIGANPTSADGYYASGTSVQITAAASTGYAFSSFSGDLSGATSPQSVVMSAPRSVTANFTAYTNVSVDTNPPGLSFSVDGTTYSTGQTFSWLPESTHTISTVRVQGTGASRKVFLNWSDGGAINHTVVTPATGASYIANFDTEYRLVTAVIPAAGGQISVSPSSTDGYYPNNTALQLTAFPATGYRFVNWSGGISGSANPASMRTSGAQAVTANFARLAPSSISGINPAKAAAAGPAFTLTVYGNGFFPDISAINWNGIPLATTFVSSNELNARIDSSYIAFPGAAKITVVQAGGAASNALQFTIDQPPSPTPSISSITPVTAVLGGPGFDLQVYGSNFLPNSVIRWNGSDRSTIFLSSKQLRASILSSDISTPGEMLVSVASPGAGSNSATFTVSSPGPIITALDPPAVVTGSSDFTLSVLGMNFASGASVRWNGSARPTTFVNSSQLRVAIPASDVSAAGNFSVSVSNGAGTVSDASSFAVITLPPNAPAITGVSPDPVIVGGPAFTLTVFGSGFVPNSVVLWNGQTRPTRFISSTELKADIAAADIAKIGIFVVLVNNPTSYGEMNAAAAAGSLGLSTVTTPIPFITKITPGSVTSGSADFRVTIDGFGFVKDTTYVLWNSRKVLANVQSATQITTDVPASDVSREGTMTFSVLNPPPGGGSSDSQTFTITPRKAPASQLYYPRLMSSATENATENTGIAIANLSGVPASITIRAFGRDGTEISGPQITNPVTLSITGVEQRAITESQVFGSGMPAQKTVGWMRLESSESKVAGFFLVFDNDLQTLDGADVSSSVMKSFVFPEIEGNGFNQFHLANPGTAEASVLFELYGSGGGSPKMAVTRTIRPNGALAEYFTDLFPGVTAASGDYIRAVSTQGLVPFSYSGIKGHDAKGVNGQDVTKGSTTLYSPQYAVGGPNWKTTLSVVNLEASAATVTLRFIGDNGEQIGLPQTKIIPGRGKLFVGAQDFFLSATELTQGYIEVKSYDGAQLAGSVVFGDPQQTRYTAALPMISSVETAMVFGQVASGIIGDETYFTGLAMLNPTYLDAQVMVELFDRDGRLVTSTSATIPANRRVSKLLTEYFPALTGQNIGSGYIKVTSDRGLASFALFGTLEALSAVPAQVVP